MLGVATAQAGRLDPGLDWIGRALRLAPGLVEARQSRIVLLSAAGRRDERPRMRGAYCIRPPTTARPGCVSAPSWRRAAPGKARPPSPPSRARRA